jgi:uncharacterized membrane protein
MENLIELVSGYVALSVEAIAAMVIAYGAIEALISLATDHRSMRKRRDVRVHFGVWLLLGLEFELAADIIRTAISPTWVDIGQLASIAGIRTFLNYFLEADIEKLRKRDETQTASAG